MSELQVCEQCQRHIRVSESACPFCGASSRAVPTRGPVRAALFAGAIASATALGCGDSKPSVTGPQEDHRFQAVQDDAQPAAPVETDAMAEEPNHVSDQVLPPPMPYGAPPARRRLV